LGFKGPINVTKLRADARAIFDAALQAADPYQAVRKHLNFSPKGRLVVVGAGKATARMAQAVEDHFGSNIFAGSINVKDGHSLPLQRIRQCEAAHPIPDQRGVQGAQAILSQAENLTADDLVLVLISGGASALLPLPAAGITLGEKQAVTNQLLRCGATIHEINAVRKHISAIKGGRLAERIQPAQVISLLLSDVIGDDLDVIGSGPTAPDPSTFADARSVLAKYAIQIPPSVENHLRAALEETPKPNAAWFQNVQNIIVGSNALAIAAAQQKAIQLGYLVENLGSDLQGEARLQALSHLDLLSRKTDRPLCILSGGECTVTLQGQGKGGRNQEFVLACVEGLRNLPKTIVLSAGTDGTDGPTDAAGAMCDSQSAANYPPAQTALDNNDSYPYFKERGDLIFTGPTGTNVMDIRILLAC
jgi:glycerate 2-kinase